MGKKKSRHDERFDWTAAGPADPIGDIREFGASVFLERGLDPFERVVVRAGLTNGFEFPRRSLPISFRVLDEDDDAAGNEQHGPQ